MLSIGRQPINACDVQCNRIEPYDSDQHRRETIMDVRGASPSIGTPVAEFEIDRAFVAGLLADQHPDLAHMPLRVVDGGWDNVMFRLGDHLSVRLPRRTAAAALIAHEQTWLPRLAAQLALPVPVPYRLGTPARGYPWRWSVLP